MFVCLLVLNATFQQYFSYIVAVTFIGGGNLSALRKQLVTDKLYNNVLSSTPYPSGVRTHDA